MTPDLEHVDESAWRALEEAITNRAVPFRYLTLCSVAETQPEARTVVLRRVVRDNRQLEFHTDIRSAKWAQLAQYPRVQILGLDADSGVQLRLNGTVFLHEPGSEYSLSVWAALPQWTRHTYCGGSPGRTIPGASSVEHIEDEATGALHFGVIEFHARSLDWVKLERGANKRALLTYDADGAIALAEHVWP